MIFFHQFHYRLFEYFEMKQMYTPKPCTWAQILSIDEDWISNCCFFLTLYISYLTVVGLSNWSEFLITERLIRGLVCKACAKPSLNSVVSPFIWVETSYKNKNWNHLVSSQPKSHWILSTVGLIFFFWRTSGEIKWWSLETVRVNLKLMGRTQESEFNLLHWTEKKESRFGSLADMSCYFQQLSS